MSLFLWRCPENSGGLGHFGYAYQAAKEHIERKYGRQH